MKGKVKGKWGGGRWVRAAARSRSKAPPGHREPGVLRAASEAATWGGATMCER